MSTSHFHNLEDEHPCPGLSLPVKNSDLHQLNEKLQIANHVTIARSEDGRGGGREIRKEDGERKGAKDGQREDQTEGWREGGGGV